MNQRLFSTSLKVRDYECDMQGIVNNAVYQHYLEHARHEFLHSCGLSFAELTKRGIIIVVVRAELDYLAPLRSGDEFNVSVAVTRPSAVRILFQQEVQSLSASSPNLRASVFATAVNDRGRPYFPADLKPLLQP